MKTWPCFIIFVLLPIAKLRPAIAGYTFSGWGPSVPQLRAAEPPTGKCVARNCGAKFCFRHNGINLKALGEKDKSISGFTSVIQLFIQ